MSPRRIATLVALAATPALLMGCPNSIRSRTVLSMFNTGRPEVPHFAPVREEVANSLRQNLPDAYWSPSCVNALMDPNTATGPLTRALACASLARDLDAEDECFHELYEGLRIPLTPPEDRRTPQAWAREQDVTRLEVNLKQVIRSAVSQYQTAHLHNISASDPEVRAGVANGLAAFREYQLTRQVSRNRSRPVSTLVMSGGAAKGAYSAGAVWWLLSRLNACKTDAELRIARACGADPACAERAKAAPENACLQDRVDMVSGTSTGSLITLLVKDYFDPGQNRRQRALDKLVQSYTCSVNEDLYCVVDAGLEDLGLDDQGKATGLVRFDGIAKTLDAYVDDRMLHNPTEYFATTVEFNTGYALHLSSADRRDIPDLPALKAAVMSSIVEPVLAEPVRQVGNKKGLLIDGGVRSGLPLLTPLMRGAERAVVFVNGPLAPTPLNESPPNALQIGMRMIDLFSYQPIVGELHEAEYELSVKRSLEYERCVERLGSAFATPTDPLPAACTYDQLPPGALAPPPTSHPAPKPPGRSGPHLGVAADLRIHQLCAGEVWPSDDCGNLPDGDRPSQLPHEVSRSYRSTWLFQPQELPDSLKGPHPIEPGLTWQSISAAGYEFDPPRMWQLFVLGAAVAQQRCAQIDDTLGWHLGGWCGTPEILKESLSPIRKRASRSCWTKDPRKLRDCPQ